jgi:PAS domain S-box-containing protein
MVTADSAKQDFVASLAMQRQRLLHHAGPILDSAQLPAGDPVVVTRLSQTLLTSLELLKLAEEQLVETRRVQATMEASLQRRLAHVGTLFDRAPVPLLLTTSDSTIREVNRAAASLLGRDSYSLAGEQLMRMVPREQQAMFRDQLGLALEMKEVVAWSFRLDLKRSLPVVVTARLEVIEDPAIGARAIYWNLQTAA